MSNSTRFGAKNGKLYTLTCLEAKWRCFPETQPRKSIALRHLPPKLNSLLVLFPLESLGGYRDGTSSELL